MDPIVEKSSPTARGVRPGISALPVIVNVLPDPVFGAPKSRKHEGLGNRAEEHCKTNKTQNHKTTKKEEALTGLAVRKNADVVAVKARLYQTFTFFENRIVAYVLRESSIKAELLYTAACLNLETLVITK